MAVNIADYLREHMLGEVSSSKEVLDYFSTDGSVLTITPRVVVYPKNIQDVRKTLRITWRLAENGTVLPITARGSGTDQAGGALGDGIIVVFPAHMNRVLSLDSKSSAVTVQPGLNYGTLQEVLMTHGMFLPAAPSSAQYSTIGGAVANNASGVRTVKYGDTRHMVQALDVVLANGDVIATGKLNKRELAKKMALDTFEGEIYRKIDELLREGSAYLDQADPMTSKNSSGYALNSVLDKKNGTFDLTPLFVGSQGTLGVITSVELKPEVLNPAKTLLTVGLSKLDQLSEFVDVALDLVPSALEVVDKNLLTEIDKQQPYQLKDIIDKPYPNFILLIEFDDKKIKDQDRKAKKLVKFIDEINAQLLSQTSDHEEMLKKWKLRDSAAVVMGVNKNGGAALPLIEDGCVPLQNFAKLISGTYALFTKFGMKASVWGHAGDANIHLQPILNLGILGDRQKAIKLMDAYYGLVLDLGGTISGEHNDGRLRAPYMKNMYTPEVYKIFASVKQIFDPYNFLNPGVKLGTTREDLINMMRHEFDAAHWKQRLPMRSV